MKPYEWVSLALAVLFGLIGWQLTEHGNEWLSIFCVAPPPLFYLLFALQKSELDKNQPE